MLTVEDLVSRADLAKRLAEKLRVLEEEAPGWVISNAYDKDKELCNGILLRGIERMKESIRSDLNNVLKCGDEPGEAQAT
jgi:hypothetical protein